MTGSWGTGAGAAWKLAAIAASIAAAFALRAFVAGDPGPLYVVPTVLAAVWWGPAAGAATGTLCAALYAIGIEINPDDGAGNSALAILVRLAVYSGLGLVVGHLASARRQLEGKVVEAERELEETRSIQLALAPTNPPVRPGLELATCYLPAVEGVAGDFYLVSEGADGSTVVAIGDVAGRGLEAAKRAWFVRTVLASSAEFTPDPCQLLELANYSLIEEAGRSETFVTAVCLVHRPSDGTVRCAIAGHDLPLLLDRGAPIPAEGHAGLPLGIEDEIGCSTSTFRLEPGEGLLLYTDGLTEARRENGNGDLNLFGPERAGELLTRLAGEPPERIIRALRDAAQGFVGGPLGDDLCMVAARVTHTPHTTEVC